MSAQLYKKGNTHTVRGIDCELKNFDLAEVDYQLKNGWFLSPEELAEGAEEVSAVESTDESTDEGNTDDGVLDEPEKTESFSAVEIGKNDPNHPVRIAAKEAGIEGWDSKRLKTLEAALNDAQE